MEDPSECPVCGEPWAPTNRTCWRCQWDPSTNQKDPGYDQRHTREDATYAVVVEFLRRNAFRIARLAPLGWALLLPTGAPWAVFIVLSYLGEAIVYRLLAGPGAHLFEARDVRLVLILGALVFVALMQLVGYMPPAP